MFMNRLQYETSPYLLQHANNPVDWYAWKPEAFEKAKLEDKPILVSIGYSTCHWCHVMEHESFENEQVAAFMNEHFVNIKVDREERPDVDQIYMEACQILTGSGGWPLNCFLMPDGRPFFAGTYYPPEPRYNRNSWIQVLQSMAHAYAERRSVVENQADRLINTIRGSDQVFFRSELDDTNNQPDGPGQVESIYEKITQSFDKKNGGYGGAPKFPAAMTLRFLLDYHFYTGQQEALDQVSFTLQKMIRGGIYDQLGGGFARYATDSAWLIPHFEKMLYDNALLISLLSNLNKVRPQALFESTIRESLAFIEREMTSPEGGFYAALDADSEGEEGKFYVWDKWEIDDILGEAAQLFCDFYGVTESGNWEGKNILWQPEDLEAFAKARQLSPENLRERLKEQGQQLLKHRSKRIRPGLDDKILLDWNGLMCSAYANAYETLQEEKYRAIAIKNLDFLLDRFQGRDTQELFHSYKDGKAQNPAYLNDYANLIAALLDVFHITGTLKYLDQAGSFSDLVIQNFLDVEQKLFYFTKADQQDIPLRKKELYDSSVPSGNATMAHNLLRLGILLDKEEYLALADEMLMKMQDAIIKYPTSFAHWASGLMYRIYPGAEVAIVGQQARALTAEFLQYFIPNCVLMSSIDANSSYPLLSGKSGLADTNIYVCQNYSCQLPVKTVQSAISLIRASQ